MVERLDHKNVKKIKTKYSFKRDINIKNIDILDFVQFVQTTSLPTNLCKWTSLPKQFKHKPVYPNQRNNTSSLPNLCN